MSQAAIEWPDMARVEDVEIDQRPAASTPRTHTRRGWGLTVAKAMARAAQPFQQERVRVVAVMTLDATSRTAPRAELRLNDQARRPCD